MATISVEGSRKDQRVGLAAIVDGAARIGRIGRWYFDFQSGTMQCDESWYAVMGRTSDTPIETLADFREIIHPDDVDRATNIGEALQNLVSEGQDYGLLFRILLPDGGERWIRSLAVLQFDGDGDAYGAAGFVLDATHDMARQAARETALAELREAHGALEARQRHLAQWSFQDSLTGLANRLCFDRDLDRACATAVRRRERVSVALIEVDHFDDLVAAQGEEAAHAALRAVATAVARAARRPHDLAARYDTARFALLLPACIDPRAILDTIRVAVNALEIPHGASPVKAHVTLSIGGVSSCTIDAADRLLQQCELALFANIHVGRDGVVIIPDR